MSALGIAEIRAAAARIAPHVHRTPVLTARSLDALVGARLYFKCENLQRAGAFKIRGATNAVRLLDGAEAARGVATHSSGNHAAALALAARERGIPAYVVMPENAPAPKVAAVRGYGAEITFCEPTLDARESTLREVVEAKGATFVPPYDDPRIVAGQGTAALELLEERREIDVVVAPVGGGGLLSGTALATRSLAPGASVYGAEPERADDAYRSLQAGRILRPENPDTIADGLRTALGEVTFPIIWDNVDGILLVSESQIVDAMRLLWERAKLVVEPSGAVPLAAVLANPHIFSGRLVGVILSGGNVDLTRLPFSDPPRG